MALLCLLIYDGMTAIWLCTLSSSSFKSDLSCVLPKSTGGVVAVLVSLSACLKILGFTKGATFVKVGEVTEVEECC